VSAALDAGTTVTIDAEDHTTADAALRIAGSLRSRFPSVGTVVQAALRRTESDVRALAVPGTRVRLCKARTPSRSPRRSMPGTMSTSPTRAACAS